MSDLLTRNFAALERGINVLNKNDLEQASKISQLEYEIAMMRQELMTIKQVAFSMQGAVGSSMKE
jgi:hypothetical protein